MKTLITTCAGLALALTLFAAPQNAGNDVDLSQQVGDFRSLPPLPACNEQGVVPVNRCEASGTTCGGYAEEDCANQSWREACLVVIHLAPNGEGDVLGIKLASCGAYETGFCEWTSGACVPGAGASGGMCGFFLTLDGSC